MSGETIKIDVNDKEVNDLLRQVARRVDDMRPVMETIGETVRASVIRNFRSGGRPDTWDKSERVKAKGGQTLLDTGRLRNSLTVEAGKNKVAVGTNVEYAAVHQFGAKKHSFGEFMAKVQAHDRVVKQAFGKQLKHPVTAHVKGHTRTVKLPWGDIPARPFLMIQDEDLTEIRAALADYLV